MTSSLVLHGAFVFLCDGRKHTPKRVLELADVSVAQFFT